VSKPLDEADPAPALAPLEVARRYHDAWTHTNFEEAGCYLAADLETDVPLNTYAGRAEFLAGLTGFGELVNGVDLLADFGDTEEAMLLYDVEIEAIGRVRVAEHFAVVDSQITRIRHVHDTVALRAAGFSENGESPPAAHIADGFSPAPAETNRD
jgi:hypothetical protein